MKLCKKALQKRTIPALLLAVMLFLTAFPMTAKAASASEQLSVLKSFQVVYVIGDKQLSVDAKAVDYSLVTTANLAAVQADALSPSTPGSGKVLCGGVEMTLPAELRIENGYVTDAFGNLMISEAALYNYLNGLFAPFTTVGMERLFMTTAGELKTIGGGNYGSQIDLNAELAHVVSAILTHTKEARYPVYASKAFGAAEQSGLPLNYAKADASLGFLPVAGNALYDIGMTYVEIDLTSQQLYYYKDGEQVLSCPVVTGDVHLKRETPTGVFYLYGKQRDRTLKGADYEAFVRYWMPVYKNIGLHDASWRGKFGGKIYQTNGSHGCINMPLASAKQLYETLALGTPVIVYE